MIAKLQKLILFLVITRLFILTTSWLINTLIVPEKPHFNLYRFTEIAWNRWDSPHYLFIANNGYVNTGDEANFIVFFPLYPLLLKPVTLVLHNPAISGILVSSIFFLIGSYYFYKLVSLDFSEKIAMQAVIALAIFPTSYFFNAPYTESLFLLLLSISLYSARLEKWVLSGIFSGLAAISRPYGFLVLLPVLVEWWNSKSRSYWILASIIFPTIFAGASYLYINYAVYGNPLEFQKILAVHWQKYLASPVTSVLNTWKIALSGGLSSYTIMVGWAEAISVTLLWILIPFVFKYLRTSWTVFYITSAVLFSSTSFILSTPRYLLSLPPIFILIALGQKNHTFKLIWNFISIGLLISLSILFTSGQWAF